MALVALRHFNSLCTIERITTTINPNSGEEVITYVGDPLLTNIPCYLEPYRPALEVRRPDQTIVTSAFHIALRGYFPQISVEDRARIDTLVYNILNTDDDDTGTLTIILAEIINSGT